jgi:hypothetical protein
MESNPNAYFYRHVAPGVVQRTGGWDADEKQMFLEAVKIHHPSQGKWGIFAQHSPGRVGYQCRNFYHKLLESGELTAAPGELEGIRRGGKRMRADRIPKSAITEESEGENVSLSEDTDDSDPTPPEPLAEPGVVERIHPPPKPVPIEEMEFDIDSLAFFSSKYGADDDDEEDELPMPMAEPEERPKWSPRAKHPWIGAAEHLHFPIHDRRPFDTPEFESQSARILRTNLENPLNLILLSFPAPKELSADYHKAVVRHLTLDTQSGKDSLLREYFETMRARPTGADEQRAMRSEFAMKVVQTVPV